MFRDCGIPWVTSPILFLFSDFDIFCISKRIHNLEYVVHAINTCNTYWFADTTPYQEYVHNGVLTKPGCRLTKFVTVSTSDFSIASKSSVMFVLSCVLFAVCSSVKYHSRLLKQTNAVLQFQLKLLQKCLSADYK